MVVAASHVADARKDFIFLVTRIIVRYLVKLSHIRLLNFIPVTPTRLHCKDAIT